MKLRVELPRKLCNFYTDVVGFLHHFCPNTHNHSLTEPNSN
jgi:hypothetical protein